MKFLKNEKGVIIIATSNSHFCYLTGDISDYKNYTNSDIEEALHKQLYGANSMKFSSIETYPFLLNIVLEIFVDGKFIKSKQYLIKELKNIDKRFEMALDKYDTEINTLNKRIVLLEKEDSTMASSWSDILFMTTHGNKFDLWISISGYESVYEFIEEVICELGRGDAENSFKYLNNREKIIGYIKEADLTAVSLIKSINEITKDEYGRWDECKLSAQSGLIRG